MSGSKKKAKRLYLIYLDKAIDCLLSGMDTINGVHDPYRVESSLLLFTNAWELLAKSLLLKLKEPNIFDPKGHSISAENAVNRLVALNTLDHNQAQNIQQLISLRNAAAHSVLPPVAEEILFHLYFYSTKSFKDVVIQNYPTYSKRLIRNFISVNFDTFTTYADKVQKLVAKSRKGKSGDRELVWLLERGIRFNGGKYLPQDEFEDEFKKLNRRRKLFPHLKLAEFVKESELILLVPIQAPKGFTADIQLRKGTKGDAALPVMIKKTDFEIDYPYLTNEIARQTSHNVSFISKLIIKENLKGNAQYHQSVRSSKSSIVNRYSDKALVLIKDLLTKNPDYNPYKK